MYPSTSSSKLPSYCESCRIFLELWFGCGGAESDAADDPTRRSHTYFASSTPQPKIWDAHPTTCSNGTESPSQTTTGSLPVVIALSVIQFVLGLLSFFVVAVAVAVIIHVRTSCPIFDSDHHTQEPLSLYVSILHVQWW